jgi:tripartite-type tricarboxylate transporter receptor subunit TctC
MFTMFAGACGAAGSAAADTVADFYKDKTLTVVIGYPAGGGFDAYGRLVADHLPRFLPGTPRSTIQYMPGASSLKAVSNIYNVAPQDGTVLGMAGIQIVFNAFVRGEVGDKVDVTKINWIGRLAMMDSVAVIWHDTGVKSVADLKTRVTHFGGTSAAAGSGYIPYAMNKLFGTQMNVTLGYGGTTEQYMAMERREIDGVTNAIWSQLQRSHPEWIREGKIVPIFQDSAERYPFLPEVPTMVEMAQNEEQRKVLRLMSVPSTFGRSFYAGPKVPPERVAALRRAFMALTEDAAVKAEVNKLNLDVWPMSGEGLQAFVDEVGSYPKDLFEETLRLIAPEKAR